MTNYLCITILINCELIFILLNKQNKIRAAIFDHLINNIAIINYTCPNQNP
jgi:hypothetical protein